MPISRTLIGKHFGRSSSTPRARMPFQAAVRIDRREPDHEEASPQGVVCHQLPETVAALLESQPVSEDVWGAFVASYTPLILHVTKTLSGSRDQRMDAYARVIEGLRHDDCRRLRGYAATPHSKFTTWLVVVSKRICIDHYRSRFGRSNSSSTVASASRRSTRRQLEELAATALDPESLTVVGEQNADSELLDREVTSAVACAVAQLVPEDRLLIALRFRDGLSTPEISRLVPGRSALSVYRRLEKILAGLRSTLASRGIDGWTT